MILGVLYPSALSLPADVSSNKQEHLHLRQQPPSLPSSWCPEHSVVPRHDAKTKAAPHLPIKKKNNKGFEGYLQPAYIASLLKSFCSIPFRPVLLHSYSGLFQVNPAATGHGSQVGILV